MITLTAALGQRYGSVVLVKEISHPIYVFRCDCGKEVRRKIYDFSRRTKRSTTCGCAKGFSKIHGLTKTREYMAWTNMKSRCNNENSTKYYNYGGRGIAVCERWNSSFQSFISDMGPCPTGFEIERINNEMGYEPANCKWASTAEQSLNRRNNRWITINGRRQTISQWVSEKNLHHSVVYGRIKRGWSEVLAISTPMRNTGPRRQANTPKRVMKVQA